MAKDNVYGKYVSLLKQIGRAAIHSSYPDDFEYYAMALELVDSNEDVIDFLLFPVMPDAIQIANSSIVNIKRAANSIVVLDTPTFTPVSISLSGGFGRKFRLMLGQEEFLFSGVNFSNFSQIKTSFSKSVKDTINNFDNAIKTGYGVCKVLERICSLSKTLDRYNQPHNLYLYNLAFNSNYIVEVLDLTFSQSKDENMIWKYNLSLTATAPLESTIGSSRLQNKTSQLMKMGQRNKAIEAITSDIFRISKNIRNKALTSINRKEKISLKSLLK